MQVNITLFLDKKEMGQFIRVGKFIRINTVSLVKDFSLLVQMYRKSYSRARRERVVTTFYENVQERQKT